MGFAPKENRKVSQAIHTTGEGFYSRIPQPHSIRNLSPFWRFESHGAVSDAVWNGDCLSGLGGVWLPSLNHHVHLPFNPQPLHLLRRQKPNENGVNADSNWRALLTCIPQVVSLRLTL